MIKISKDGFIKAGFTISTTELRNTLKLMKSALSGNWEEDRPYCELTIKTNSIELVVAGIKQVRPCEAWGPAKVTISFLHLLHLIKDSRQRSTKVIVGDDFMTIDDTTVDVVTWFFQDDSILRSIDLPANYDVVDILNLPQKYTAEEIEFNKLKKDLTAAQSKLYEDIQKVAKILKKYRIYEPTIQRFIYDSFY